jgi:hypothetical protein
MRCGEERGMMDECMIMAFASVFARVFPFGDLGA